MCGTLCKFHLQYPQRSPCPTSGWGFFLSQPTGGSGAGDALVRAVAADLLVVCGPAKLNAGAWVSWPKLSS